MSKSDCKIKNEALFTKALALLLLAIISARFLLQDLERSKMYDEPARLFNQAYSYTSSSSIIQGTIPITTTTTL